VKWSACKGKRIESVDKDTNDNPRFISGDPLPDRPGSVPERDDQLGYSLFAKHLAQAIARVTPTEGLVISLYGPWGSGKSTVLNFVETYLAREAGTGVPAVVRFNPWWFSGQEDLIRAFFDQMLAQLTTGRAVRKETKIAVQALQPLIVQLLSLSGAHLSIWAKLSLAVSSSWGAFTTASVPDLKVKIGNKLESASKKILVIVDDIDRLSGVEVREVFRLIKSVADFPNVTYLLAFDREAVCRMLQPEQGGSGEEYLGKIVQIPFELPAPDLASLQQMLFLRLNAILAATPEELFDKSRWREAFTEGVSHLLNTPRDVVRLSNTLSLTYGPVRDEVDAVDFVAIETLRVFAPKVYDVIRRNREMFCDLSWRSFSGTSDANLKKFHDGWFDAFRQDGSISKEQQDPVRSLLTLLFPRLEKFWSHPLFARSGTKGISANRRIRDFDVFPVFFQLSVPETSISRPEVIAMLSVDSATLAEKFRSLAIDRRPDGISRARAILEVIPDFVEALSPEQCVLLVVALISAGDELLKADRLQGNFLPAQEWLFAATLQAALHRLPPGERFSNLSTAFRGSAAVGAMAWTVSFLRRECEKSASSNHGEGDFLITNEEVSQLETITLAKIRESVSSGQLVNAPDLFVVLSSWAAWTSAREVEEWIKKVSQHPLGFAQMLEGMLSESTVNGRLVFRLDPEMLRPFVDPDSLIDPVRQLASETSLSQTQRTAVDSFVKIYDARKEGRDPEDDLQS
jgi:predicted KAP-like P-loop ATPase